MNKPRLVSRTIRIVLLAALVICACAVCTTSFAQPQQQATSTPATSAPAPSPAQQAPPPVSAVAPEMEIPPFAVGVAYGVSPTEADPSVTRFTATNLIVYKRDVARNAPLLVWFSGTGGTPMTGWLFIQAAAKAGYRVIGLMYDNGVSDPQTCGP